MPHMNFKKLWKRKTVTITESDPTYKVIYLGNVVTGWAKGDGCVDKPLATLWKNYCQSSQQDISMKLTICSAGLKAVTREHGLTEYWAHRVTHCASHSMYPQVFCWVYRHEGRRLKQELRCHAVLCPKLSKTEVEVMAEKLRMRLSAALHEFRREKFVRQNARLSLVHAIYDSATLPRRKALLSTGMCNYRPPLERSKSAPKLGAIEEIIEEEEEESLEQSQKRKLQLQEEQAAIQAREVGSASTSETTSDIVADYDSGSETGRSETSKCQEDAEESSGDSISDEDLVVHYLKPSCSPSHLWCAEGSCTVPELHPSESAQVLQGSVSDPRVDDTQEEMSTRLQDKVTLSSNTTSGDSVTSEQPESLGTGSCNSSCEDCNSIPYSKSVLFTETIEGKLFGGEEVVVGKNEFAEEDCDNISEESGYSEDKECLQQIEAKV